MIAGHYHPDRGRILLNERSVGGRAAHELYHLGLARTFQIAREFASLTVLENLLVPPAGQIGERLWWAFLRWGAIRHQEAALRERARDALAFLKLDHLADEPAGNLSGGQKKLLELGRVMMSDCTTVLLDEIGAGVNRTLLGELAGLIERLNQERGYTFWVIEHDMDLISRLCDPVIVMAEGTGADPGHHGRHPRRRPGHRGLSRRRRGQGEARGKASLPRRRSPRAAPKAAWAPA